MSTNHEVPIEVTSRHEDVSEKMKEYATEKAAKLLRFHNRISRIQIIIDGAHEAPSVEMLVHVDSGSVLVAKDHEEHFKNAMDQLADKMERQLKKNNERRKHHKGHGGKVEIDEAVPAEQQETFDDVVRRKLDD